MPLSIGQYYTKIGIRFHKCNNYITAHPIAQIQCNGHENVNIYNIIFSL